MATATDANDINALVPASVTVAFPDLSSGAPSATPYAANVTLAYAVTRGAEYVQSVSLSPAAWPAIGSGEAVPFDVAVSLNAAWAAAPDGTEVKLQVFVEGETNRPGHHPGQLTVTLVALCATASPTALRSWT